MSDWARVFLLVFIMLAIYGIMFRAAFLELGN
jgi:hypothetical protein